MVDLDTNEKRVGFAQEQLRNFTFLFAQAVGGDRTVS
jgi:hypothetical protein